MVPQHTHEGSELTLVLEGAFRDKTGRYARGDLALADGSIEHRPVAEPGEDCMCLTVTDAPLRLTGTETALLRRLAASRGQPVSRADLIDDLGRGGGEDENGERAIDVQITRLRRKIEPDPREPRFLQTVRGTGYMLVVD